MQRLSLIAPLALLALSACGFNEGLIIEDMTGRVVVPAAAATRDVDGETIKDVRFIGPVILGLYPSVRNDIYAYPHPSIGPVFNDDIGGNTYPYGGTMVGDFRYPCVQPLVCKVTSGRFVDYDSILTWFKDVYDAPVTDATGAEVLSGAFLRQTCLERLRGTSDEEVRITAYEDRNEDGVLDANDLEFVENADGDFEAEFKIWQQEFFEGFSLWGYMDSPALSDGRLSSCDPTLGFQAGEYTTVFTGGAPHIDLLNYPAEYITEGDWVSTTPHVYTSVDDEVVLNLDFEVTE